MRPAWLLRDASRSRFNASARRGRANPVHFGAEAQRRTRRMHVRIDEAWNDGASLQIDRARRGDRRVCGFPRRCQPRGSFPRVRQARCAWRTGASTVRILPLTRMVSGACADAGCRGRNDEDGGQRGSHEPLAHESPPRRSRSPAWRRAYYTAVLKIVRGPTRV